MNHRPQFPYPLGFLFSISRFFNSDLLIFPVVVSGNSLMNSSSLGTLFFSKCRFKKLANGLTIRETFH